MAAAEVRAVWQRTANRFLVQEDAKRAPKLACCQPPCATSRLVDAELANAADESANSAAINVMPFSQKSSISNLSPDSRRWLQVQAYYGHQKSTLHQQSSALDDEPEMLKASDEDDLYEDFTWFGDEEYDSFYHVDSYGSQVDLMKKASKDEILGQSSEKSQPLADLINMTGKHETMGIDSVGCSVSKQMDEFNLDSTWTEGDKAEPWWQTTDRDELASFVLMRSLNNIENCDLPPPQRKYVSRHPCDRNGDEKIKASSFNWDTKSYGLSNLTNAQGTSDSPLMHGKQSASANEKFSHCAYENSSSYITMHMDTTEEQQTFEGDQSKAQLMEALCHSQTRAREAEGAAKQAYAEKEQVVRLIFKQASQIFAYKQWFRLLQLEKLLTQIKNKDQPLSTLLPAGLPWMTCEGRKPRKRRQKLPKIERLQPTSENVTTYAVAIALGLSIVGAGLLLGCCVGWMLPHL